MQELDIICCFYAILSVLMFWDDRENQSLPSKDVSLTGRERREK